MTRSGSLPGLVIENLEEEVSKRALTSGAAAAIWLLTDGAHGHPASDRSEESFLKKFSKSC